MEKLQVGKLLLGYKNHILGHPEYPITREIINSNYVNDPTFNHVVNLIIGIKQKSKDNKVDIYKHLSIDENIQVLDDMSINFSYNEQAKVVLIRDGKNSIDFYPSTNKWKDNNDNNRMHLGNAHLLLKDGMDF